MIKNPKQLIINIFIILIPFQLLFAADSKYVAIEVSAIVSESPFKIELVWPEFQWDGSYEIYRRTTGVNSSWGASIANPSETATGYIDTSVTEGILYEYKIKRGTYGDGYIICGINMPPIENRGTVIFIVDNSFTITLSNELHTMKKMLVGDGYQVIRHDVNPSDSVLSVKNLIVIDYNADPTNVKTVYLFGKIPVPYSGLQAFDGHTIYNGGSHEGAWPADCFYGDMDGIWSDTGTMTNSKYPRNRNVPGDGKYDNAMPPTDVELMVGRVDLKDMFTFSKTETELLRNYITKNSNYRHRITDLNRRAILHSTFGSVAERYPASDVYRDAAAWFGQDKSTYVAPDTIFSYVKNDEYMLAHGDGGGWMQGSFGVGNTGNFATDDPKTVFWFLFGSWYGDFDYQDNFLRAPLATDSYGLTSVWRGFHHQFYHHMAMGYPIANSLRIYWNNPNNPSIGYKVQVSDKTWVHNEKIQANLMGDPTLRLSYPNPPTQLNAIRTLGEVVLDWQKAKGTNIGYHIYGSKNEMGPYQRLSTHPVTNNYYIDTTATNDFYMIKNIILERSGSGTYSNLSTGIFSEKITTNNGPAITINIGTKTNIIVNTPLSYQLWVSRATGYWSTNNLSWSSFTTISPIITIDKTTTLYYYAEDGSGNSGTNSVNITFDLTAPTVTITTGPSSNIITNESFNVELQADEPSGYWSTNGITWIKFQTTSTSINFTKSSSLQWFGMDNLINSTPTNSIYYTIEHPPILSFGAGPTTDITTNCSFLVTINVDSPTGYWSTNEINYYPFESNTNIFISNNTTLSYYTTSSNGFRSGTNRINYIIIYPKPEIIPSLPYPNPISISKNEVIQFEGVSENYKIEIFDLKGTKIWSGFKNWNLKNMYSLTVTPGIYTYKIYSDNKYKTGKLLILE